MRSLKICNGMLKNKKINDYIVIVLLLVVSVISFAFSAREYYFMNRLSLITSTEDTIEAILVKNHAPLSVENVNLIDTWMTFSYINTIFKLPPNYLKDNLQISNRRYPNMSLIGYIRGNGLDRDAFLESVRTAVTDYFKK